MYMNEEYFQRECWKYLNLSQIVLEGLHELLNFVFHKSSHVTSRSGYANTGNETEATKIFSNVT